MMPGDLRQRSLGWECHDERALGNPDMRGQAMLLAGVTWMGMGVFVMKKMIAFKF